MAPVDDATLAAEKANLIFEQDCLEFRSLNGFLWQVPIIVSTLTGGLWFGVAKLIDQPYPKAALYGLAAVVNIAFIIVLRRVRMGVMEDLLDSIHSYQGRTRKTLGRFTMIRVFTAVLLISALISLISCLGALLPHVRALVCAT